MTVRDASDERNCSIRAACEASRMASVRAPDAFSAKSAARWASAAPNADASRAYRLRAPTRRPSDLSGSARHDRMPWAAARRDRWPMNQRPGIAAASPAERLAHARAIL